MTFFGEGYSEGQEPQSGKPNVKICTQVKGPGVYLAANCFCLTFLLVVKVYGFATTPFALVKRLQHALSQQSLQNIILDTSIHFNLLFEKAN